MTSLIDLTKASSTTAAQQSGNSTRASRASSWPPGKLLSTATVPPASYEQVEAYNDQAVRPEHQTEQSNAAADGDTRDATDDAEAAATDTTEADTAPEEQASSPAPTDPAELRSTTPAWPQRAHLARKQKFDGPYDPKLAAYMCRTLGLACAHRPHDLVYQPLAEGTALEYISHAELWRTVQLVEAGKAAG